MSFKKEILKPGDNIDKLKFIIKKTNLYTKRKPSSLKKTRKRKNIKRKIKKSIKRKTLKRKRTKKNVKRINKWQHL